jgi:hypothetical protein
MREEEGGMAKPGSHENRMQSRAKKATLGVRAKQTKRRPAVATMQPSPLSHRRAFTGFDLERATYEQLDAYLLASDQGNYVVIVGDEFLGPLESHKEAERAGYNRFGLGPLYVKQVAAEEPDFGAHYTNDSGFAR